MKRNKIEQVGMTDSGINKDEDYVNLLKKRIKDAEDLVAEAEERLFNAKKSDELEIWTAKLSTRKSSLEEARTRLNEISEEEEVEVAA